MKKLSVLPYLRYAKSWATAAELALATGISMGDAEKVVAAPDYQSAFAKAMLEGRAKAIMTMLKKPESSQAIKVFEFFESRMKELTDRTNATSSSDAANVNYNELMIPEKE
jgi:hypothetical protein